MAQPIIQTAFASGEWAPKLRSRVDIQKYRIGASLLRNFFVDWAGGGASTRQGTAFCNQAFKSGKPVRLIPFQPSTNVGYVLEFGDGYIRFYQNGAPVLETGFTVTAITGNSITAAGNNFNVGDWVFIGGLCYIVLTSGSPFTVSDLFGNSSVTPSGSLVQRVYTLASPYAAADLFANPVTGNPGLKYVQDVTSMIICHTSYRPQILTVVSATNWSISTITFGATIPAPVLGAITTNLTTTGGAGWLYSYTVTAVDTNGQESPVATPANLGTVGAGYQDLTLVSTTTAGASINISWGAVTGAASYNVYKAAQTFNTAIPTGTVYGFIGNTNATSFQDTSPGILPDFSQTPPIIENPFVGAGVQSYTVTASGAPYSQVPTVTVPAPSSGTTATAAAVLQVTNVVVHSAGNGYAPGDILVNFSTPAGGLTLVVTSTGIGGLINSVSVRYAGAISGAGTVPPGLSGNPWPVNDTTGSGTGADFTLTWGVGQVQPIMAGSGYTTPPSPIVFSPSGASATAVLVATQGSNPGVPGFLQERLVLAGQLNNVQSFNLSQPGSFFNFNTTFPVEDDDAISGNIIAEDLNAIRSLVAVPTGMLAITGKAGWLVNGGGGISTQTPITPTNIVAQPQGYHGSSDIKPLKINQNILYVTNKGEYVRDLTYNVWSQLFSGVDITAISTHLFQGTNIVDWCWCEEPLKTVWAVRNDGVMLSLAYVKEQELIGWAHHDTNGQFTGCCAVVEVVPGNGEVVDAVYLVVQRIINGQTVKYIERMADRYFTYGYEDAWSVDAALRTIPIAQPSTLLTITGNASAGGNTVTLIDSVTSPFTALMATNNYIVRAGGGIYKITGFTSASTVTAQVVRVPSLINAYTGIAFATTYQIWQPVSTVSGLTQLEGQAVTGVADGTVINGTVSSGGVLNLGGIYTKVTIGLAFTPQLTTLPLDMGEPTVQSKRKKVNAATMRVADTLGLQAGTSFPNVVTMKDFQIGAIPSVSNGVANVTDLVNGDGRQILDQVWQEVGQLSVQQNLPYPATILSIMPEVLVGDTEPGRGR
jgi:hypothetical protein